MKVKALVAFKTKLSSPCRKILVLLRLKKPLYIRPRGPCSSHVSAKHRTASLFSVFRSQRKSKEMNRVRELTDPGKEKLLFTLPHTPASAKRGRGTDMETEALVVDDVVEEACRSFEKYLSEMIVEEGNVSDLMDVEELLYCWKNIKSPVFAEMVSRFYGELCKDLFSPEH
uniref:OVATE domain-containing protein n=1 Tax=Kalanchoe fedtschenkoi TaxID=63787 RepID=A0A7N0TH53_KALFE